MKTLIYLYVGLFSCGFAGQSARAQNSQPGSGTASPVSTDASAPPAQPRGDSAAALLSDINAQFTALEAQIEVTYAKLLKESRDQIATLQDKIRAMAASKRALEEAAAKTKNTANKLAAINSEIAALDSAIAKAQQDIAKLIAEIEKLEQQKAKEITQVRKQKEKALRDAKP